MGFITELFALAGTIIVSFGSAAAILGFLSTWLGKVWAQRILEKDRSKYAKEIEALRSEAGQELERLRSQLDRAKQTELRIHSDKILIYRSAFDIITPLLVALEDHHAGNLDPATGRIVLEQFRRGRLQLYGYLGMFAPQSVMDAQDALMDYLLEVINGETGRDWSRMRSLALYLLNEIRLDVGLDKTPIEYRGAR